jgi:hypothetical protein
MWLLARSSGALIAWAPTLEGLPPPPPESVVVERPAWDVPPAEPYRYDPTRLDWVVPAPVVPALSRLAFRWRFAAEEQIALKRAELEHPDATVRATLAILRESLAEADEVRVDDPRTVQGAGFLVDVLVGAGVLDAAARDARLAQILAPPGS